MNWQGDPGTENRLASPKQLDQERASSPPPSTANTSRPSVDIRISKHSVLLSGKEVDVFTMSLGSETIELLPHKNWGQLDLYKWCMRGKLPASPAGLDIALDRVKLGGEMILAQDPDACQKLQKLFSDWLALELETLELAKRKAQAKSGVATAGATTAPEPKSLRFRVEQDKEGQVHVLLSQGKETLAVIGLNNPGFQSLVSQGLMRKPHVLKTGALHNWVELDGVLYSFEKGNNDSAGLERVLNDSYLPAAGIGGGKEIVVFSNAASSTGFDIQFPAKVGGVLETKRRPLNEETLNLLQDPEHCGLLHKEIVIKLTRPTLIFKKKTSDGGEIYLRRSQENQVRVVDEDGVAKVIELGQPVSYLHLSAVDLTAVFNHPAINRHGTTSSSTAAASAPNPVVAAENKPAPASEGSKAISPTPASSSIVPAEATIQQRPEPAASSIPKMQTPAALLGVAEPSRVSAPARLESKPNSWLKSALERAPIRYDWLRCLLYEKIAAWFGNSREAVIMEGGCWFIQTGQIEEFNEPGFKGLFLTDKGSFGFVDSGFAARFQEGVMTLGSIEAALKLDEVRLAALGVGAEGQIVFVVAEGYRQRAPELQRTMKSALVELERHGAMLMSVSEILDSSIALQVLWTAPADQPDLENPQALEHIRSNVPVLGTAQEFAKEQSASAAISIPAQPGN